VVGSGRIAELEIEFSANATLDNFFEQLMGFLNQEVGAGVINAFAECSQLRPGYYSSHFKKGEKLETLREITKEEFQDLKKDYEYFKIAYSAMNSAELEFHIFHDGSKFLPDEIQERKLRRVVEKTIRYKIRELRDLIVGTSFKESRLEEFFHSILKTHLSRFVRVEKASIFFEEAGYSNLVLGASTGIKHRNGSTELSRTDVMYEEGSKSETYKCFETGKPLFEKRPMRDCRFLEDVSFVENRLYMPLCMRPSWAGNEYSHPESLVGVLRLTNFSRNGELQIYSDVDYFVLSYVCEYLSVLCNQYINVMKLTREHDRATHGYNTDLASLSLLSDTREKMFEKVFDRLQVFINSSYAAIGSDRDRINRNIQLEVRNLVNLTDQTIRNLNATHDSMATQFLTSMLYSENSAGFISKTTADITKQPFKDTIHRIIDVFPHMCRNHKANSVKLLLSGKERYAEQFKNIPAIKMPPEHLYLVLRNLVENSVKYFSPRSNQSYVNIRWIANIKNVRFDIIDNGIGVPDSEVDKIFTTGYRADNALSRTTRGMGLGLSNCRHISSIFDAKLDYVGKGPNDQGAVFSLIAERAF